MSTPTSDPGPPRRRRLRRVARVTGVVLLLLLAAGTAGALWLRGRLTASLPRLDGETAVPGLGAEVVVERDGLGVPTIRAADRDDVARATGFLHGQERFFQMDLLRRVAAGELAEIFGPAALEADRSVRRFGLRAVARRVLDDAVARDRDLMVAYAVGVNAGLTDLGAPPFEYLALRTEPAPWLPEDGALAILAMCLTLHDETGQTESALGLLADLLPPPVAGFLAPEGTEWDAPLRGPAWETPAIPGPGMWTLPPGPSPEEGAPEPTPAGSNNWAVSGAHTADGRAILAGDMHLPLSVPNIWYRASLQWSDEGGEHRLTGVTLPGTPVMVAGSNGHVAWTFTNTQGDWVDLVILEIDERDPEIYATPDGPQRLEHRTERIRVKGADDDRLDVSTTIWGPVLDRDHRGRPRAVRWTAMVPGGTNLRHGQLEHARTVEEAIAAAQLTGSPPQNILIAGGDGRIGWTILGRIPRRVGFDGRVPTSWADGTRRWDGWLDPPEYPAIVDPPEGLLWTANARTVDGEWMRRIGLGHYVLGARARQIRDDLVAAGTMDETAMLTVQLDDRADFLDRWRALLLELLDDESVAEDPRREGLRRAVEDWGGRASIDSVGYRAVRAFRLEAGERVLGTLTAPLRAADDRFHYWRTFQYEGPLWRLVSERPDHLLDPSQRSWEDWLRSAADQVIADLGGEGGDLSRSTWGERNVVRIRHPLSRAVPRLGPWLDMPARPLPGDGHMPRVQGVSEGASQRMAVSPGHEQDGYFHMPCGQSGHPLSPHYRDGQRAWAEGEPTPFLPGPALHELRLVPAGAP